MFIFLGIMPFFGAFVLGKLRCTLWAGIWLLLGCQPVGQNAPSKMAFEIQGDTVVLDKSHILATQTKLYQPSFELSGVILPHKHTDITSPITGTIAQVFVQKNSPVSEGEPLFEVLSQPDDPSFANDDGTDHRFFLSQNTQSPRSKIVHAPFSGVVSSLHAKKGTAVQQNDLQLSLDDNHLFEFVSFLPKAYEPNLTVGQTVNFAIQSNQIAQDRLEQLTQSQTQSFASCPNHPHR